MLSKTGQKQADIESRLEQSNVEEHRKIYPAPLYCHSVQLRSFLKSKKAAFGKFGPEIAELLSNGRPLIVNDHMPITGAYDRLTPAAAIAFAHNILAYNVKTLYDKYSPYGEPEPEKMFADFSEEGKGNVQ